MFISFSPLQISAAFWGQGIEQSAGLRSMMTPFAARVAVLPQ
jgi:hypothetical protein